MTDRANNTSSPNQRKSASNNGERNNLDRSDRSTTSSRNNNGTPPTLEEVSTLLQQNIEIRDRKYRLKTYTDCFVGSEVVDYLVEEGLALNRVQAVVLGQKIMKTLGHFEHVVTKEHEFMDDYLFYHFIGGGTHTTTGEEGGDNNGSSAAQYRRASTDVTVGSGGTNSKGAAGGIIKMDKYGFLLDDDRCKNTNSAGSSANENSSAALRFGAGDAKRWETILDKVHPSSSSSKKSHHDNASFNSSGSVSYATSQSKVKYYARRGLPDVLRQKAWTVLTGVDLIMAENPGEYDALVDRAEEEWNKMHDLESAGDLSSSMEGFGIKTKTPNKDVSGSRMGSILDTIERDIHRTFPKHFLFHSGYGTDETAAADPSHSSSFTSSRSSFNESELGSDDEEEADHEKNDNGKGGGDGDSVADQDDIATVAASMGKDAASIVEEKRKTFNESITGSIASFSNRTDVGVPSALGKKLMVIGEDNNGNNNNKTPKRRSSLEDRLAKIASKGDAKEEDLLDDTEDDGHNKNFTKKVSQDSSNKVSLKGSLLSQDTDDKASIESFDLIEEEDGDQVGALGRMDSVKSGKSTDALGVGEGQGALRRVLRAYSMYDSEVGYCQGMNFITAMFLTFLSEEEAFWLLVVVMNEEPYKLRELFGEDMAGTHEVLYIAEKLLAQFLPKLARHLEEETIHVSMFVTQWLLTLYTSTFPFDLVARVWDSFLVEGWKVVYRVMLSLLENASSDILELDFEEILAYFKEYPSTVNGPVIMAGSLKIALKRKHIQKHVTDWRRHAGGGLDEGKSKGISWRNRRRASEDTSRGGDNHSVSSSTMNSINDHTRAFPKIAPPRNFLKKQTPREISVENLSDQLLPVIGVNKFAVLLHNVLTPAECSELIDRAEENGFEDASIYDRRTNHVHRNCERNVSDDLNTVENWFERIAHALKDTPHERKLMNAPWIDTLRNGKYIEAVGLNERLRLLRYKSGEFFHSHNDATFVRGADQGLRAGEQSYVSVHVYLNQKFKGGNTTFHARGRYFDVKPRTGSILIFEHNILHEGQKVTHGKKYVVRTDIMYTTKNFQSDASGTTLTQQL